MEFQHAEKRSMISRLRSFVLESRRVFLITRKPTKDEFKVIVKVSGIGIIIIGLLGFFIQMIWHFVK